MDHADLTKARQALSIWQEYLAQLSHLWGESTTSMVRWDYRTNEWIGAEAHQTRRVLGAPGVIKGLLDRARRPKRTLRAMASTVARPTRLWDQLFSPNLSSFVEIPFALPNDVVIKKSLSGKRFIAASKRSGLVVKLSRRTEEMDRELSAMRLAEEAGIGAHVPQVLDSGFFESGVWWVATELAPNTDPVTSTFNLNTAGGQEWQWWLQMQILPAMARFYSASGVEVQSLDERIEECEQLMRACGTSKPLQDLLECIQNAALQAHGNEILVAKLHQDLHPTHVHRSPDQWKIIDWGDSRRGDVLVEPFTDLFRQPVIAGRASPLFKWLSGELGHENLPSSYREYIDSVLSWQHDWRGVPCDVQLLRAILLIYLFESIIHKVEGSSSLRQVMDGNYSPEILEGEKNYIRLVIVQLKSLDMLY